ncbi:unnamed protein product [Schistosoma turkestanicum]|nr:unnamed protein product [Schistosoma turkestanicum]
MNGISIQLSDQANRLISESAFVPFYHTLTPGSSSLSKCGTLIPNRIFVGGIPSNTTEQELKSFFSSLGQVKDVKIINDRPGASKGSYGFVTFESQEIAEQIIKNESEKLIFKDRKLNISHAIRRQQILPRTDLTTTLFFAGSAVPYSFQNSMAVLPLPGQEYSVLTPTAAPYATVMLPQPDGGTTIYFPFLNPTLAGAGSPYTHIPQHAVTAALQQQFNQTGNASCLAPTVVGQITPISASINNTNAQPHSTPAVITAAAAAAMAAVVQRPQHPVQNNQQHSQQSSNVAVTHSASHLNKEYSINHLSTITQHQSAITAQHPANWLWPPGVQQPQNTIYRTSPQTTMCTNDTSSCIRATTSTPTITTSNLQLPQQVSNSALSLFPSSFGALPSTLQLLQNSTLTASTAALLAAAAVIQQPNTEMNMNFDMSTAATLAALATASINSSLMNTNMNSVKEATKAEEEDITTSEFSKPTTLEENNINDDAVGLSFTQPAKKPRYDIETVHKI